jgi:hypothetical protein
MAKTRTERIDSIDEQIKQLGNQRKQLIQKEKAQERKDRTRRLCQRMGLFESMLPETITLTDDSFKTFLEKSVLSDQSRRILDGLTAQNTAVAAPIRASAAAQSAAIPASQTAQTEQDEDTDEGEDEGNGARVKALAVYRLIIPYSYTEKT